MFRRLPRLTASTIATTVATTTTTTTTTTAAIKMNSGTRQSWCCIIISYLCVKLRFLMGGRSIRSFGEMKDMAKTFSKNIVEISALDRSWFHFLVEYFVPHFSSIVQLIPSTSRFLQGVQQKKNTQKKLTRRRRDKYPAKKRIKKKIEKKKEEKK